MKRVASEPLRSPVPSSADDIQIISISFGVLWRSKVGKQPDGSASRATYPLSKEIRAVALQDLVGTIKQACDSHCHQRQARAPLA
jgi:hypothetical protein